MKRLLLSIALFTAIMMVFTACGEEAPPSPDDSAEDDSFLVLVNDDHLVAEDREDDLKLDTIKNYFGDEIRIDHETYTFFLGMREELLLRDVHVEISSAYRSIDEQRDLWEYAVEQNDEKYAEENLDLPGYSEHHTGFAIDIFIVKDDRLVYEDEDMLADEEDFKLIQEIAPKYGFIVRYPKGKEDITGHEYEPWHLRYVGSSKVAKEITERGITLEEYLSEK